MTFNRFIFKTVLANYRKYAAYFLCISFSMMILFLFSSIWFAPGFSDQTSAGTRQIVLIGGVLCGGFSVFLITYAYHHFLKNRNREMGILLSYGLLYRDLKKMIILENSVIFAGALLASLASGSVLARLIFMVTTAILELEEIRFSLTIPSFLLTAACFALIYLTIVILTLVKLKETTITAMMQSNRLQELRRTGSKLASFAGLAIMFAALLFLYLYTSDPLNTDSMQKAILFGLLACIAGICLWMNNFIGLMVALWKRRATFYHRNLLILSEFASRFAQNRSVILMVCLLSIGIVFFATLSYTLYNQSYEVADKEQWNDVAFKDYDSVQLLAGLDLEALQAETGTDIKRIQTLEVVYVEAPELRHAPWRTNKQVIAASSDTANLILPEPVAVTPGAALVLDFNGAKGEALTYFLDEAKLAVGHQTFSFRHEGTDRVQLFDRYMFPQPLLIVLHEGDYRNVADAAATEERGTIIVVDFADWMQSGAFVEQLKVRMNEELAATDESRAAAVASIAERYPEPFTIFSKYDRFAHTKRVGGFALFILSFISLLFFVTVCVVLYFKVFADLEEDRRKIKLLHTIGVTSGEVKHYLEQKLKMVIALPVATGSLIGLILCVTIHFGQTMELEIDRATILVNGLKITALFAVAIAIYYAGLKSAYRRSV
ncbi:FtsX-like permease family protein [Paenibacillus sp. 1P07SE]|uniref:FtsX-like permease family protein n=1 Tax=Paenibacillus sp. 1P07SE TaxID=3132209 RepID=UPI0039A60871